ncbi:MAG: tetratricopeptide repeat protein [Gelidibacter sp.]
MAAFKKNIAFVVATFMVCIQVYAQTTKDSLFAEITKSILKTKPTAYSIIDKDLSKFKYDSLKMKVFANKAMASKYYEGESYAENALGSIYRNLSLYEKAIEAHQKAKTAADKTKNIELQVISFNMLGVVYRRMDLVKPALDYHKKALDLANANKPLSSELKHSVAVSQNSMGNIYLALKQYDLALNQFSKSIVIEKESDNKLGLAINYQNIGYVAEAKGFLDEALKNYNLSLDYNNAINSEIGRVICYNSIGQIYIKQQKYDDAKKIIEKALKKALTKGDQFYIAFSYINLGWVNSELNLNTKAEDDLKIALKIGKDYHLKSTVVDANKHLSTLYSKKGDYKTAMAHYVKSIEIEESISNERNLQYVNDIIVQYENESKNNQIRELANENERVKLKLETNKKIFWYSLLGLIIIAGIMIIANRNRQLSHEKQILTLEQDMLRSQMNPHFIFNSLNSIKLYIINNEKENAVYYLNKFSKFIRKILIASTEKEISLEDELDTMQLYMNIENIRFSNQIDFKITVDKNINTLNIRVPSLILQPFLENALWHGLSSKKNDKQIHLNVYKVDDESITITITDNGIGRKASEKINFSKVLKRKSVGLMITKARLANFSKAYTTDYKIEIEDLHDHTNKPSGTKVIVTIPTHLITKK